MDRFRTALRRIAGVVAGLFLASTIYVPAAQASMVGTQALVHHQQIQQKRERIKAMLDRKDVRKQLVAMGVDPVNAKQRVDSLTDRQVNELSARMDQLPAGAGVFEATLFAGLVVFLVLLATDIMGYTDVFPFVKKTAQ